MIVNIFKPKKFLEYDLSPSDGVEKFLMPSDLDWTYATSGKSCIYHIVKALNVEHILLPVYACSTILTVVSSLNIKLSFYDVEIHSLNPSFEDIKQKLRLDGSIDTILAVSLYGNPCCLEKLVLLQQEYSKIGRKINVIDDAAQSYGAFVNGKRVGSFGSAGFFSFSPGKPTSGPLGAYFWTENKYYSINRTRHYFYRKMKFFFFKRLRYDIDKNCNSIGFKCCQYISRLFDVVSKRIINVDYDRQENFELSLQAKILKLNLDNDLRRHRLNELITIFQYYPKINSIEYDEFGVPFKFVVIASDINESIAFKRHLKAVDIFYSSGYKLLSSSYAECPNAHSLIGKIIELPIDDDLMKHKYMLSKLNDWVRSEQ